MLETVSKGFRAAKNRLAGKAEISPELVATQSIFGGSTIVH